MGRNELGRGSSLLVALPALAAWLVLGVFSAVCDLPLLAAVFCFLFFLTAAARLWSRRAMKGVSLEMACGASRLYPGMTTEMRCTVKNEKLLPLVWLELSQNVPERECIVPDDSFERYTYLTEEGENTAATEGWRRTFSFVAGYETLTVESIWTARRRGLYRPDRLLLRSGDGFGLTQMEQGYPAEMVPEFAVYPRRVPVDVSLFLRSDWERAVGLSGCMEDMTVLRGLRPYSANDSWKRINWRMAARQPGELRVNFYETVKPSTALFVLDGESFCGEPEEELEEVLEVLASVIDALFERGVCCGLCLPRSKRFPAVSLPPAEERSAGELLYYLAGYDCLAAHPETGEGNLREQYLPSRFDTAGVAAAATQSGMTAVITRDPDGLPPGLMRRLPGYGVTVFSAGQDHSADPELRVLPLSRLKKEGSL